MSVICLAPHCHVTEAAGLMVTKDNADDMNKRNIITYI